MVELTFYSSRVMKKALVHLGPGERDGRIGLFHHPFDLCALTLSGSFRPRIESFEALVRPRWAMKNALLARLRVNAWPSKRFSSPC
jgi:hypothetical protein